VEKNLGILTRPRMGPVRGYQEGGEVEDYADPMSGYQMQSPDDQAVRDTLDASRRFHDSDRWWERSAGLPADIRRFREAVSPDIAPGAEQPTEGSVLGRAVENIRDYISGTGPHAATPRELDDERQRQEYATTQGGITPSEQVSPILRGRREGATEPSPVSYKGATPEETAAALGPAAGKSVRRKLEQVSAAEGYRPVETRADTVVAPRIGEAGYIPQPEEVGYVKGTPSAPDISLTSDRPAETVRAAYRQFPDDPASREAWLAQQPRDVTIPTAEEQVARKAATEEQFGRQIMLERAAGAKGGGAGIQLEMLRRPEQVRQQEADRALRQATLNQRVQEELGRGGRGFTGEAGKNIRQKMKDDPSLKSLTPEEMQILQDVNRRAAESLQRRGGATEPTQTGGGPKIGDVVKGYRYMGGNPAEQDSWEKV
jgi:hypothetical protein